MPSEPPGPMEPARFGTREQILEVARKLFNAQGYDATSLRQIADELRLTKAALYYHFPAKELLLLALTQPFLDGMSRMVTELRATEEPDPEEVLAAYLDLFVEHIDIVGLLGREPATQHHPDIGQRVRSLVLAIQQQLSGPDPSPTQSVRTACAMGVVHAVPQLPADVLRDQRNTVLAAALAALREPLLRTQQAASD
jgi:AcrR family transcriptional regulator